MVDPPKSPTRSESSPERHTNHPALKPVRRDLRAHATPAERALWQALKGSQLGATFRRQHSIGRHVVDFYCPTARLAVELDGGVHDDPARAAADSLRQADLQALGVRVLRFANRDVLQTLDLVAQALRDALADALPHLREDA